MKKSKKFILGLIVVLIVAIGLLLVFPDLLNSKDTPEQETEIENVDELEDSPFD